jgi:hypothetical protein
LFEGCSGGGDNNALVRRGNASAVVLEVLPPCCPPSRALPPSPAQSGFTDPERLGSVVLVVMLECPVLLSGVGVEDNLDRLGEDDGCLFSTRSRGDFVRVQLSVAVWDISLEMPMPDEGSLLETGSLSPRRTVEDWRGGGQSRTLTPCPSVDSAAGKMSSRRTCVLELLSKTYEENQQQRQMTDLCIHIPSFPVVLLVELAGISKPFFAGESSSLGGRELAPVVSKDLFKGFSGEEDNVLARGGRKASIAFLETPLPCCPPSPACPPPPTPSGLIDSE